MEQSQNRRTTLYEDHTELKARMGEFGGWDMPIQYSGILSEVDAVRKHCGIFDVSHMGRIYITGVDAPLLLNMLVTSPVLNMKTMQARYGLMCNGNGGIIDDMIYYKLREDQFLLIPNAGNREAVLQWITATNNKYFNSAIDVQDDTLKTDMLAVQGPNSKFLITQLFPRSTMSEIFPGIEHGVGVREMISNLKFFEAVDVHISLSDIAHGDLTIARTGYTGEDGLEIITHKLCGRIIRRVWDRLRHRGTREYSTQLSPETVLSKGFPCGLGARDVLRLEAALPLYGHELDINTTPVEAGLHRFIKKRSSFIGSEVIHRQLEKGTNKTLIGLTIAGKRAPRQGYSILQNGTPIGVITSGSYSPTLDISIALGYVSTVQYIEGVDLELDIRGKIVPAHLTKTPFYRRGA